MEHTWHPKIPPVVMEWGSPSCRLFVCQSAFSCGTDADSKSKQQTRKRKAPFHSHIVLDHPFNCQVTLALLSAFPTQLSWVHSVRLK